MCRARLAWAPLSPEMPDVEDPWPDACGCGQKFGVPSKLLEHWITTGVRASGLWKMAICLLQKHPNDGTFKDAGLDLAKTPESKLGSIFFPNCKCNPSRNFLSL